MDKKDFYRIAEDKSQLEKFANETVDAINGGGGFEIIDLGDLDNIGSNPTGYSIPGIYNRIVNSTKPILLTGINFTSMENYSAKDLAEMYMFTIDSPDVKAKAFARLEIELNDLSLKVSYGYPLIIDENDYIYEAEW